MKSSMNCGTKINKNIEMKKLFFFSQLPGINSVQISSSPRSIKKIRIFNIFKSSIDQLYVTIIFVANYRTLILE